MHRRRLCEINGGLILVAGYGLYYIALEFFAGLSWVLFIGTPMYLTANLLRQVRSIAARPICIQVLRDAQVLRLCTWLQIMTLCKLMPCQSPGPPNRHLRHRSPMSMLLRWRGRGECLTASMRQAVSLSRIESQPHNTAAGGAGEPVCVGVVAGREPVQLVHAGPSRTVPPPNFLSEADKKEIIL